MKAIILIFSLFLLFILNPNHSHSAIGINHPLTDTTSTVTDADGHVYKTVNINNQTWMSENLNTSHYRDGTVIPEAKTVKEWKAYCKSKTGCWCYYNNDSTNGAKYGKLYNWYAVSDLRQTPAPKGWRVPTENDFMILAHAFPIDSIAVRLKSTSEWHPFTMDGHSVDRTGCGTNESGFNALPAGIRTGKGAFAGQGTGTYFWSSTPRGDLFATAWYLGYNTVQFNAPSPYKWSCFSVRCVKEGLDE